MENDATRNILDRIRNIQESISINKTRNIIKEEVEERGQKALSISDDPKFGQQVLSSQIEQFRSSVDGGAEFGEPSDEDVASSPLIFMPSTKNLVFSGIIPSLNNLKFQMVLRTNTGSGCFIWADGLIINENNLKTLHKLQGFYENWKNQWQAEAADLERMAKALENKI